MSSSRPPEEAALDPWVGLQLQQAKNVELQLRLKADADKVRAERRAEVWNGVGVGVLTLAVLGLILFGIVFTIHLVTSHDEGKQRRQLEIEQERTAQVDACTALTEPAERQLCIITIAAGTP